MWVEPIGILSMPVSSMCVACSWLGKPCVIERMTAYLSDRAASFGKCSQIS